MSERRRLIAGNWKMNLNHLEAIQVVQKIAYQLDAKDHETTDVVVCPPFTSLRSVQTTLESDNIPIQLGAQNVYWEASGAFTGEISPTMLAKLNVKYVIVGHSERREVLGETDEMVARKVNAVLAAEMVPIVCVGETLEERESEATEAKIDRQVEAVISGLKPAQLNSVVIAYEPIWAIGTGRNATPEDANATIGFIRQLVGKRSASTAEEIQILYGGSVKAGNAAELMAQPQIDGALVGGASLDPDEFVRIIKYR